MEWLTSILGGGTARIIDSVSGVVDEFYTTEAEHAEAELKKEKLKIEIRKIVQAEKTQIEKTVRKSMESRERIIVAEMQSGDSYTRRARPTIVYVALAAIVFNYCVIPTIQTLAGVGLEPFELPQEFWWAFSACIGVWSAGRSAERIVGRNRVSDVIAGNNMPSSFVYADLQEKAAKG